MTPYPCGWERKSSTPQPSIAVAFFELLRILVFYLKNPVPGCQHSSGFAGCFVMRISYVCGVCVSQLETKHELQTMRVADCLFAHVCYGPFCSEGVFKV